MIIAVVLLGLFVLFLFGLDVLIIRRLGYLSIESDNMFERIRMIEHDVKIDRGDY
jgi:uncharacterized membrane protein